MGRGPLEPRGGSQVQPLLGCEDIRRGVCRRPERHQAGVLPPRRGRQAGAHLRRELHRRGERPAHCRLQSHRGQGGQSQGKNTVGAAGRILRDDRISGERSLLYEREDIPRGTEPCARKGRTARQGSGVCRRGSQGLQADRADNRQIQQRYSRRKMERDDGLQTTSAVTVLHA